MSITIKNLSATLAALALAGMTAQAAAPSLSYKISDNELIITYTGTLYQSSDAVVWSQVTAASSPYKVALGDKKQFFCAKAEEGPSKNITIPLSDKVNLDLIWIEPGTFTMGSPEDELGRESDETQHEVTLTQGYWLGKFEVTQAQYEAVMGENPSRFTGADLPVEKVTWNDAKEFCVKLTEIEKAAGRLPGGYEYTLPTEAQWEYACRAGTTTALNSGKNLSDTKQCPEMDEVGWYGFNSDETTHPAGQKKPNAWGLYDMHGNVFEWCLDWYGKYPASSVTDPTGPSTGSGRVVRGGSWLNLADNCRSAYRNGHDPDFSYYGDGFRVALSKSNKGTLTITINDTKAYDGIHLVSGYSIASASGLLDGDKLTAGAATSAGSEVGSYSYPGTSTITTPFETAMGIANYDVTYVINQTITDALPDKNIIVPLPGNVKLPMIWIEPGTFTMGSPEDELGRYDDETQHKVTLSKGYWLGKYEVTQAQYKAIMGNNPSDKPDENGIYRGVGDNYPVYYVTWNDAMDFCAKLTEIEKAAGRLPSGYEYTLPTEAQWEYACRAGTTTALNSGKNLSAKYKCSEMDEVGWYQYNSDETHPVGQKQPNAWICTGMYMNGVWTGMELIRHHP
jgi:formylglycine-generating enzyme required for sulfatase activity